MKFGFYGHKPSAKRKRIVEVGERSDVLSWSVPLIRSSHCRAFLKGLGTNSAYSTAKRFAKLNYAGRLVSLSACTRWQSLRRLLNEPPQFGFLPFHTRFVREVCKLARLKDETVGNREFTVVCFLFCFEALTRMPVVGFWVHMVGKLTRRASHGMTVYVLNLTR